MVSVNSRRGVLFGILGLLMTVGAVPAAAQTEPGSGFVDDDGNIHELNIEFIKEAGITKGCNPPVNDQYCPQLPVTRAELASFMARAFALPASATDHFGDDDTSIHEGDINAIADAGFVFGCGTDLYCPDDPVTRAELASVFVRAFGFAASTTDHFVDDDASIHEADINALAEVGVTQGCSVDPANYCPFDPVLRDQFASFMARALRLPTNEPPVANPGAASTDEDTPIAVVLSGTDTDGDTLTYNVVSGPADGSLSGVAPDLTYTPNLDFFGTDAFTFTVNDGDVTSGAATFDLTVAAVNDAPVLGVIGDRSVDELVSLGFTASATDVDVPANGLTFSLDAASVVAGMSIGSSSGVFEWTPSEVQGPGVFSVTVTVADDGLPGLDDSETFDVTVNEINVAPTAAAQAYDAVGNVSIVVPAGSGLLTGAADSDTPPQILSVSSFDATTTGGGSVTAVNSATGAFTYTPTAGYNGADTFTYTVQDDGPGTPVSASATVTITVADTIWFIDNSAAGTDDGTLSNPFQTTGAFNASGDVAAGDNVYLAETGTDYTTGILLADNQKLVGEGASGASLDSVLGITLPTHSAALPAIGGASPVVNATGSGVAVASGNEVRGLDITTTGGVGLTGAGVGVLTVDDVASISSSGAAGIVLSGGSAVSITVDAVTVTGSPSGGINLTSMPGTTNLAGINITTTGGTALLATNAGTINVTGSANSIDATNGPAVSLTGTTIGLSGMTFGSISASAGSTGIVLNGTGTGAFVVTGDGPSSPADLTRGQTVVGSGGPITLGSGGTIANTNGDAIQLTNASNVTLRNMVVSGDGAGSRSGMLAVGGEALTIDNTRITGFSDDGIHATGLVGLTVTHTEVETNAKSTDSIANDESNVTLTDVSGVALFDNSLIRDVHQDNVRVSSCASGPCGGTSLSLTFDNVAISDTLSGGGGNDGILVRSFNDANVTLVVTNSEFTNNRANGIQHTTNDAATAGSTTVTGSVFYGSAVEINIAHQGTTHSFNVANNTIRDQLGVVAHTSHAVNVFLGGLSGPSSVLSGTISGNTIGNAAIADSGSLFGQGIELFASGAGTLTANVTDNTVRAIQFGSAFRAISSSHTGLINVTAKTNTFDITPSSSGFALAGLDLTAGATPTDTGTMCADILGNTSFVGDLFWAGAYVTTAAGSPTIELVGYAGAANDPTVIEAFLDSAATTVSPSASGFSFLGAGTVTGRGAPCPQP